MEHQGQTKSPSLAAAPPTERHQNAAALSNTMASNHPCTRFGRE